MKHTINTANLSRAEWLKLRQKGIGGSDVAAILGLSKWKTPLQVYYDKTGEVVESEPNAKMIAGIKLENVIADWFTEQTGFKTYKDNKIRYHAINPVLLANIDRIIINDKGERGILEIKTTSDFAFQHWHDEIPEDYYLQILHYLNVLDLQYGYFAILINGWDFRYYEVKRHQLLIDLFTGQVLDWWDEHIIKGIPPEPVNPEEINTIYPVSVPTQIEADLSIISAYKSLKSIREQISGLEKEKEGLELTLKSYMKDNEILTIDSQPVISWKSNNPTAYFNKELFKKENYILFEKYCELKNGNRVFKLLELKNGN
jgi:putative phage-type endonuclease